MPKVSASEFAEEWASKLSGSVTKILNRVEKVSESPGKKAAANRDVWAAKMASKEVQDKWARNTGAVTLEEWKSSMRELVPQRLPGGVEKAKSKVQAFAEQLLPYQEAGLPKIHSIKKVTLEDSRRRMNEWFDYMSKFRKK